ncbi:MAG: ABC-2 transporter permease [Lachnospiraceae bacterium]|nr:ABC-2 transporter permease [Lachnospiraceae bacterium]
MKGLIIKDLKLVFKNKVLIVLMALFSLLGFVGMDSSFMVGYFTLFFTGLAISTCGYDERNNTVAYLLTMPVSRMDYVIEKYLFTTGLGFIGYALSVAISFIGCHFIQGDPYDITSLSLGVFIFLIPTLMIPINIKFGTTKGRLITLAISGIIAFIIGVLVPPLLMMSSVTELTFDEEYAITEYVVEVGLRTYLIAAGVLLTIVGAYVASFFISLNIIKKKNY